MYTYSTLSTIIFLIIMCVGKHLLQFSKVVVNGYHSTGQLVSNIITCNMDVLYILYKYLQYLVGVFHDCTHQVSLEVNTTFHAMPDQPHPIHFSANSRSSTYCWLREENTEVIHKAKAQSRDMYARTKYLIPIPSPIHSVKIVPGTRPFRSVP